MNNNEITKIVNQYYGQTLETILFSNTEITIVLEGRFFRLSTLIQFAATCVIDLNTIIIGCKIVDNRTYREIIIERENTSENL